MSERVTIDGRFLTQPVTGVQRVGIEFCRALDQLLAGGELFEVDVTVAVPRNARLITLPEWKCIRLVRKGRLPGHLWEQFDLPIIGRKGKLLALSNTAPLVSLLFRGGKTFVMIHDLSYRYFPSAYKPAFRLFYEFLTPIVLRHARCIFTVSESERSAILQRYPCLVKKRRIVAVQNGGSEGRAGVTRDKATRDRNCLYVGSLTKRKNAEGILAAAIELVRAHRARFTFIGSTGVLFEQVGLNIPEDVADSIEFLGQVDDPKRLASEYAKAAVLVFPSFYEASPLPPIEAMAQGCPVVVSAIPSLKERCGEAAVYCDPKRIDSIVNAVVSLLDSAELWNHQQEVGFSWCRKFSWEAQTRRVIEEVVRDYV